jgi:hypothetical protein
LPREQPGGSAAEAVCNPRVSRIERRRRRQPIGIRHLQGSENPWWPRSRLAMLFVGVKRTSIKAVNIGRARQ